MLYQEGLQKDNGASHEFNPIFDFAWLVRPILALGGKHFSRLLPQLKVVCAGVVLAANSQHQRNRCRRPMPSTNPVEQILESLAFVSDSILYSIDRLFHRSTDRRAENRF
jgi:hypothetical protein